MSQGRAALPNYVMRQRDYYDINFVLCFLLAEPKTRNNSVQRFTSPSSRLASPPTKENNPPLLDDWRIARNKRNRRTERNVSTKYTASRSFSSAGTRRFYADLLTIVFEMSFRSRRSYRENFPRNSIPPLPFLPVIVPFICEFDVGFLH